MFACMCVCVRGGVCTCASMCVCVRTCALVRAPCTIGHVFVNALLESLMLIFCRPLSGGSPSRSGGVPMTAIRESRESRELATPSVLPIYTGNRPDICNTYHNFSGEKEEENRMEEEEEEEEKEGLMTRVSSTERGLCALYVHTLSCVCTMCTYTIVRLRLTLSKTYTIKDIHYQRHTLSKTYTIKDIHYQRHTPSMKTYTIVLFITVC